MPSPAASAPLPDRFLALRRGASGCCPRCGTSDVFRSAFRLHARCPDCGLPLEMEDGWSYGSVPLAYALVGVFWVLPLALAALLGALSPRIAIVLGLAGGLLLPIATYRFTKKLWIGIYYALLPLEMRYRQADERGDVH